MLRTVYRLSVFALMMIGLVGLTGCPKKGDTKDDDQPTFKAYSTGIAKYDRYFQRVYRLRYKLWKAERDMATTPATLRSAMGIPSNAKKASLLELLKTAAKQYGSKLLFQKTGFKLAPSASNDPNAGKVVQALAAIYTTTKEMPKNLGDAVSESKQLIVQGKNLTQSVDRDFTGMKKMKIPGVTAALAESVKELGKVPAQVAKLGKTSANVALQIPKAFAK